MSFFVSVSIAPTCPPPIPPPCLSSVFKRAGFVHNMVCDVHRLKWEALKLTMGNKWIVSVFLPACLSACLSVFAHVCLYLCACHVLSICLAFHSHYICFCVPVCRSGFVPSLFACLCSLCLSTHALLHHYLPPPYLPRQTFPTLFLFKKEKKKRKKEKKYWRAPSGVWCSESYRIEKQPNFSCGSLWFLALSRSLPAIMHSLLHFPPKNDLEKR